MQASTPPYGMSAVLQQQWQAMLVEQLRQHQQLQQQQQQQWPAALQQQLAAHRQNMAARFNPYAPQGFVSEQQHIGATASVSRQSTEAGDQVDTNASAPGGVAGSSGGTPPAASGASKYRRHPKPPYSYIHLIAMAIRDSAQQKATLAEINEYLMNKFPFFQGEYQGWKNSIRHNLSLNDCFVKVLRDPSRPWAKDNFWTLNADSEYTFADGVFRRRRRRVSPSPQAAGCQSLLHAGENAADAAHRRSPMEIVAANNVQHKLLISPSASSDLGASFSTSTLSPTGGAQSSLCSSGSGGSNASPALSTNCRRFAMASLLGPGANETANARPDSGLCTTPDSHCSES